MHPDTLKRLVRERFSDVINGWRTHLEAHSGVLEAAPHSLGLDVALYGEYEAVRHGADEIEAKLLLQHTKGPFDTRLNLKFGKELEKGQPIELGYAVSADWAAFGEFRLGAEAFGNLGTTKDFLPRDEHFAGPMVRTEIEHLPGKGELEIEAGYLFALGKSRDETNGQLRLVLEYEFHF